MFIAKLVFEKVERNVIFVVSYDVNLNGISFCENKLMRNLFLRIWPKTAKVSSANYNGKQQSQK